MITTTADTSKTPPTPASIQRTILILKVVLMPTKNRIAAKTRLTRVLTDPHHERCTDRRLRSTLARGRDQISPYSAALLAMW